jgi:proton-dependent oligopeptide transporter, POT family
MENNIDFVEGTQAKKGHPKGLWVLFGTEMWERFNFYGMRAILTLFLVNSLLMKEEDASLLYGGFLGLCYLTPMLGGFIADRFLGNRNCIMIGGFMMAAGQGLLFFSATVFPSNLGFANTLMWTALGVIVFGNGFFKPNISSMVGSLYPKQEKSKLDTAFTIFYMGINLGAFLGQTICPIVGDVKVGGVQNVFAFKWGFLAASIAMLVGTMVFYFLKNKYVVTPEGKPLGGLPSKNDDSDYEEGEAQKAVFSKMNLLLSVVVFIVLFFTFRYLLDGDNFIKTLIYPIIYSAGITLALLIISDKSLTKVELQRILVIYIVAFFIIFFWAAFEQAGSSLTFIASNQTDRHIFGWEMPASMVQVFNGVFVFAFALPFSILWDKLRAKGREPISPAKQAIGLLLIAVSYFIIAYNVKDLGNSGLLAVKWLILLYLIQTFAELCLSPIGLSLVGKLSPKRFSSLLFGVFFLSNAAGYALSGSLGSILPPTGDKYEAAKQVKVDLGAILDKKKVATGEELFALAKLNIASVDAKKAKVNNIDIAKKIKTAAEIKTERELAVKKKLPFVDKHQVSDTTFTAAEYNMIRDKELITVSYPKFVGFTIHGLFEFFMVFVVLTGVASLILFLLIPTLKKMMHGVR